MMTNEEMEKKCVDLRNYLMNNFSRPCDAIQATEIVFLSLICDHAASDSDRLFELMVDEMKKGYEALKKAKKDA
jgi:hypothetical protein